MFGIMELLVDKLKTLLLTEEDGMNLQHVPVRENVHNNNEKYKNVHIPHIKVSLTVANSVIDKYIRNVHTEVYSNDPGCSDRQRDITVPYLENIPTDDILPVPPEKITSASVNSDALVSFSGSTGIAFPRTLKRKLKGSDEYIQKMETIFENKPFPLHHSNTSDVESTTSTEIIAFGDNSEIVDKLSMPLTSIIDGNLGRYNQNDKLIADVDYRNSEKSINVRENIIGVHEVKLSYDFLNQINKMKTNKHLEINGSLKVRDLLKLTKSDNISLKSNAPFQSSQTTRTLLEYYSCKEDEYFNNPLYWAACRGDIRDVILYGESGLMIHYKDHDARTPLHMAILDGNLEIIKMLLRFGSDPNSEDVFGFTPLHYAVLRRRSIKITRTLFSSGAVIPSKQTPMCPGLFLDLVILAKPTENEVDLLFLLLQHGALLDDPTAPGGRQALHYAAMSNNAMLTSFLLQLGADANALNSHGMTPLEVAKFYNCGEVVFTIEEIGLARIMTDSRLSINSTYA